MRVSNGRLDFGGRFLSVLDWRAMSLARWSVSLVAIIGVLAATIAAATIWLLLTDPVTVADAVSKGDVSPVMQAIGAVILGALKGLFRYL